MKRFITSLSLGALITVCALSMAQAAQDAKISQGEPPYNADSLCAKADKIVFSCPLAESSKIVSLCAAGNAERYQFYYVFGRPHAPEMTYPAKGQDSTRAFAKSHLMYAGATGGYTYSFINQGYKYILYAVSGTGFDDGGILIQRAGEQTALKDMKCQPKKITESDDDLLKATQKWKIDPDLNSHGLPDTQ